MACQAVAGAADVSYDKVVVTPGQPAPGFFLLWGQQVDKKFDVTPCPAGVGPSCDEEPGCVSHPAHLGNPHFQI